MSINCKDCKYFDLDYGSRFNQSMTPSGNCHRYPPAAIKDAPSFPRVKEDDWCGEFLEKELS